LAQQPCETEKPKGRYQDPANHCGEGEEAAQVREQRDFFRADAPPEQ